MLLGFLCSLLVCFIFYISVDWIVHISMVRDSATYYGWAGYRTFKTYFEQANWNYDGYNKSSLFGDNFNDNYFHANIIKFHHNGMIINNPFSYFLVKLYVRKYIKNNFVKQRKSVIW